MTARVAKAAALAVAVSVHATLALALLRPDAVEIEGAASGGAEVRLGTAFEDMVQGTLTTAPVEQVAPTAAPPEEARPAEPQPLSRPEPAVTPPVTAETQPDAAASATPERLSALQPTLSLPADLLSAVPLPSGAPDVAAPLPERLQPLEALRPETTPIAPLQAAPVATETVSGEAPDKATVARSLRPPVARTEVFEQRVAPLAEAFSKAQQAKRAAARPAQGNANRNARVGSSSGSRQSSPARSGSGGRTTQSGSAAASNYPGVVMSCVSSRAGRPNVRGGGTARVSFSISSSGAVSGVGLARSSGNAALDRAAVAAIRSVGRCPPPPPGAQRSFSIAIQ